MRRFFVPVGLLKSAFVALFLLVAWAGISGAGERFETEALSVTTKDGVTHRFQVELALTPAQRQQGLMNRREMGEDAGMLFVFKAPQQVLMWMKNTYLPLDMLFVGADGTIRSIHENAQPLSENIIDSRAVVAFVVELNAGMVKKLKIGVGNRVTSNAIEAYAGSK